MNGIWEEIGLNMVPEISDADLIEMRSMIEPLMIIDENRFHRICGIDAIDPRDVAFTWSAKPDGPQLDCSPLDHLEIVTFHRFGAPSLFKPSLAEAYASIRRFCPDWKKGVKFFALQLFGDQPILGRVHVARCHLFGSSLRDRSCT